MPNLTIHTRCLTAKEVKELTAALSIMDVVESADYRPDVIGKLQDRSPMMVLPEFHIVLKLVDGPPSELGWKPQGTFTRKPAKH